MNLLGAWKKVLLFGLYGALGCLAGWAVGEGYLLAAKAAAGSGAAGTLISKPAAPTKDAPPPPSEFKDRLEREKAKTGDVQVSLIWFNKNDLDLHCVDPTGNEIFFRKPRSPSNGELDVDANGERGRPLTTEPIENIYWPVGGAPPGKYTVYVNLYNRRPGEPASTKYKVSVLHGGKREEYEKEITDNGTSDNKQLIREFSLSPHVEVFAPPELTLHRAETMRVPVAVRRSFVRGKVDLTAENLPEGVTFAKGVIAEGKDEGEIELKVSDTAAEVKKSIKIVATAADAGGSFDSELVIDLPKFSALWVALIGVWTALLAVGLCLALVAGQNRYLKRPLFASGRVPLPLVVFGVAFAGFLSGSVGQALFSVLMALGAGGVGFVIGWVLLGGLLGWGVSWFVSNLDKKKAALAGLVGGLLGAVAYLVFSNAADLLGRLAGAAVLGFCIGLVVAMVEAAFRRAWLEVKFGDRETILVNLGPEPVKVGDDSRSCTVWARGAAPVALRFFVRDGKVICDDVPSRVETVVGDGFSRTAGAVTLTVRTGASASPAPPPVPRQSAPALPPAARPQLPPPQPSRPQPAPVPIPVPVPVAKAPPPAPKPQGADAPRSAPAAPPADDYDDGMPMPMGPAPSARPKVASILDDDYPSSPPPRPAAPKVPAGPVARPPVPAARVAPVSPAPKPSVPSKPPVPAPVAVAPVTKPPAPVAATPAPAAPAKPPVPAAPTAPVKPPVPGAVTKPPVPGAAKPGVKPPIPVAPVVAPPKAAAPLAPVAPLPPAPPAKPPVPGAPAKPPVPGVPSKPTASVPSKPAAPSADAKTAGGADACPTCGRTTPGKSGKRYCVLCDKTY